MRASRSRLSPPPAPPGTAAPPGAAWYCSTREGVCEAMCGLHLLLLWGNAFNRYRGTRAHGHPTIPPQAPTSVIETERIGQRGWSGRDANGSVAGSASWPGDAVAMFARSAKGG